MTYMAMSVTCKQGQNNESLLIRYKNCFSAHLVVQSSARVRSRTSPQNRKQSSRHLDEEISEILEEIAAFKKAIILKIKQEIKGRFRALVTINWLFSDDVNHYPT